MGLVLLAGLPQQQELLAATARLARSLSAGAVVVVPLVLLERPFPVAVAAGLPSQGVTEERQPRGVVVL